MIDHNIHCFLSRAILYILMHIVNLKIDENCCKQTPASLP